MSFDPGLAFGFTRGRDYGFIRYEGEIGYFRVSTDDLEAFNMSVPIDADNSAFFFLLNGWFQRDRGHEPSTPYGGIGLGFARAAVSDGWVAGTQVWGSDSDYVLALQLGAGVRFRVTDEISLDVRYRYFATTDPEFESADAELHAHMLMLGGVWVDE
jgi:opacity protein-like surface antigen